MAYTGAVNHARISQLRDHLSRYLDRVRAGGEVVVLDRQRPIARIVPIAAGAAATSDEERLVSLERRGLLRRGSGRLPAGWSKRRPAKVRGSVLGDLRAERESGF